MHASPAPVPGSPAEIRQDARARGLRTLGQTVIGAVPAGLILVVGTVLTETFSTGEAVTLAGLTQALVPPVAAYLWRRWEGRLSE